PCHAVGGIPPDGAHREGAPRRVALRGGRDRTVLYRRHYPPRCRSIAARLVDAFFTGSQTTETQRHRGTEKTHSLRVSVPLWFVGVFEYHERRPTHPGETRWKSTSSTGPTSCSATS